jgi:hypothetical protein
MAKKVVDNIDIPDEFQDNGIKESSYVMQEKSKASRKTEEITEEVVEEKTEEKVEEKKIEEKTEDVKTGFSFDDFKDVKEYKSIEEIKEDLKSGEITKSEYNQLKQDYEALKNKEPENIYEDDTLFRLAKIKKDKPEDFETYIDILYNKKSPIELLKMDFIKEHPEYKDKLDRVEKLIKKQYSVDEDIDEDDADAVEERDIALMKLELDSKKVSEKFLKDFNEIKTPVKIDTEKLKIEEKEKGETLKKENRLKWQPIVKEFIKGFDKFPIYVSGSNGKQNLLTEYDVPAELKTKYEEGITEFLVNSNQPFAKESIDLAKSYLQSNFVLENLPDIIKAAVTHARSLKDEDWSKEVFNPSAFKEKTKQNEVTGVEAKNEEEMRRSIEHWKV